MLAGFISLVLGAGIGEFARRRVETVRVQTSADLGENTAQFGREETMVAQSGSNPADLVSLEDRADQAYENGQLGEAEKIYRQAADLGSDYAMHSLGFMFFETDPVEAKKWFTLAAQAGNEYSMNNLGTIARDEGNFDEAEGWYIKAAESGHSSSFYWLGLMAGERGLDERAREWFLRGAEAGDLACMHSYARPLEGGEVSALADKWADIVQEEGTAEAAWWFQSRASSKEARAKWALLAAERGHPKALRTTSVLDHPDRERVRVFLEKAAETGDKATYGLLGRIYMEAKNYGAAEKWLLLSAKVDADGKARLVQCYVEAGKLDEAAPLMDKANRETAFAYAMHKRDAGDLVGFEKWLLHAVSRTSDDAHTCPEALELARLYESQGKIFQAETWYRTAVVAEGTDGNRSEVCEAAAEFFDRLGDAAESGRMRSGVDAVQELTGTRWPAREVEEDILYMFFLYYCDPEFDNRELMQWAADHFFALANSRSLLLMKYKNQGWGFLLRRKAFLSLLDIVNVRRAIEGMDPDERPSSIYEFIELVESTNPGRFARHDEI